MNGKTARQIRKYCTRTGEDYKETKKYWYSLNHKDRTEFRGRLLPHVEEYIDD